MVSGAGAIVTVKLALRRLHRGTGIGHLKTKYGGCHRKRGVAADQTLWKS